MSEPVLFDNYSFDPTPNDVLEYAKKLNGICGEASIGALLKINVKDVLDIWGIDEKEFKGFTLQKDMIAILKKAGYSVTQKRVKDKHLLPNCHFGIIRVAFGKPDQHWMKTAKSSHYICIKRFQQGTFVYDNAIYEFDGVSHNGVWIEKFEYYKWMKSEEMFITSYLDISPHKDYKKEGLQEEKIVHDGIPPNSLEGIFEIMIKRKPNDYGEEQNVI